MTNTEPTKFSLDDMMRKVHALLTRADHENTPLPEAEACRAKAEALMYRYRIDEAMFEQAKPAGLELKPQWATWNVCRAGSEFAQRYRNIASAVLEHLGIRGVFKQASVPVVDEDGNYTDHQIMVVCEAVGYESDLRIAELLYTECQLAFQLKLEPKYQPDLTESYNAYVMRSAGMEGWRIAQAMYGRDDKHLRVKVRKLFKEEAMKRGEDPTVLLGKGNSVKAFREDFAMGFTWEIQTRLRSMRMARTDEGELVLASRNEAINEMFYEAYPHYRPQDPQQTRSSTGFQDPRKGCAKCAKAKSGYCREHAWLKPSYAKVQRGRQTNYAALDRGQRAARDVNLGGSGARGKVGDGS